MLSFGLSDWFTTYLLPEESAHKELLAPRMLAWICEPSSRSLLQKYYWLDFIFCTCVVDYFTKLCFFPYLTILLNTSFIKVSNSPILSRRAMQTTDEIKAWAWHLLNSVKFNPCPAISLSSICFISSIGADPPPSGKEGEKARAYITLIFPTDTRKIKLQFISTC